MRMRLPEWMKRPAERRRAARRRVADLCAVYWDGRPDCSHPIREISSEGAYIETGCPWAAGTLLRLNIVSGTCRMRPHAFAEVWSRIVRPAADGFCVEFLWESAGSREEFTRFLEGS